MGKENLGEFEELVLLMIALLKEDAYGLGICEELKKQTGRSAAIGAVHATLSRLANKGLVKSSLGDPTKERGGRRKRLFTLTASGKKALVRSRDIKVSIWTQIPELSIKTI
ncbi:PadR family transcriptional regulator [Fulvivirgaceae bacterium BMA12]|uniref:PadR family transcriptional regulator n=1 Tax=Agaribacillus aureus TaxID=3051825 RepID=A0ABT8L4I3_9BACT|nr:PadR family transcriptional regulator [Fulvivirgaceae bacterium BMA12]